MLKAGGTIEEYEAKADSIKENLRRELKCFMPACELTVTASAGSVILTVVATDTSGSQVELAAMDMQTKTLDAISSALGVTIEEPPAAPSVSDVEVQVTRHAPLPSPASPPTSPPTAPPSSPSAPPADSQGSVSAEDQVNSPESLAVPPWVLIVLLLVVVLLVVMLLLGFRRHSRISRERANFRISRDRANLDLQMISHQVQTRGYTGSDDSVSVPDSSSTTKRSIPLRKAPAISLPPGPPSSSNGQSVLAQEEVSSPSAAPATWLANRFGTSASSGQAHVTPAPSAATSTAWPFSALRRASSSAASKRSAQPESAFAPRSKRASTLESQPAVLPLEAPPASESSVAPPISGREEGPEPTAVELETFLADEDVVLDLQSLQRGASAQINDAALTAPASGIEDVFEPTEAELAAFLEDEEMMLEIQSLPNILGGPSSWNSSDMIANANAGRQRVLAHREQEAVKSTPTPPDPEYLTAMSNSISTAPPERSAQLESASASRVTELDKTAAVMAEREAKWAEWQEWEAKKAATTKQRLLLAQQRAVLQQRQRRQQQEEAMQRLEQQQRRQQQQQKTVQMMMQMKPDDTGGPGLGGEEPSQGPVPDPSLLSRPPYLMAPLLPTATQQLVMPGTMPYTMVTQDTVNVNSTLSQVGPSCWSVVGPSCSNVYSNAHGPPVSLGSQSSTIASTPEQQALQAARDGMRAARDDIQRFYVLRTLAAALGASRPETGTISALHSVLLQLDQPSLSCEEACESTGASMSNFKKWRRRVHQARLNVPSEYRVNSEARHRMQ